MKTLCRASASGFTLEDAHTLTELENMTESEREACVFAVEHIFLKHRQVILSDFFAKLAHSGLEIYLKKINLDLPLGTLVRLSDKEGFFALGEVREYADGLAIKPIRQFE
jgi:tRNA U55 pseudouridine synthase TruB